MSLCTLPILYLNLGGEMLYIIRHRLQAQDVHPEKAHKGTWQDDYLQLYSSGSAIELALAPNTAHCARADFVGAASSCYQASV